jgi:hypothetical protein
VDTLITHQDHEKTSEVESPILFSDIILECQTRTRGTCFLNCDCSCTASQWEKKFALEKIKDVELQGYWSAL